MQWSNSGLIQRYSLSYFAPLDTHGTVVYREDFWRLGQLLFNRLLISECTSEKTEDIRFSTQLMVSSQIIISTNNPDIISNWIADFNWFDCFFLPLIWTSKWKRDPEAEPCEKAYGEERNMSRGKDAQGHRQTVGQQQCSRAKMRPSSKTYSKKVHLLKWRTFFRQKFKKKKRVRKKKKTVTQQT